MGHPLLHLPGRLEPLQLERDVRAAQEERHCDPVLGHLDRAFVRVRVTQKSGEVDENPLSHGDTRQSLRPSMADIEGSLLNRVGLPSCFGISSRPPRETASAQRSWESRSMIAGSSRRSCASASGAGSAGPRCRGPPVPPTGPLPTRAPPPPTPPTERPPSDT